MLKKILISGFILCSLLVVSINSVIAAGETKTITDDAGDVLDYELNPVSRPNVDIIEISYIKNGKNVELKIKLTNGGEIQNSDSFVYMISLVTSDNRYNALYGEGSCLVLDFDYNEMDNVDFSGEGTNTFTVSFDLYSSDEECIFAYAIADEITDDNEYTDYAPTDDLPVVYGDIPLEDCGVGESIDFSADADGGTSPYTWLWDFGDGETWDEQDATHVYDEAGTYKVVVLVTDSNDYSDIYYSNLTITGDGDHNGGNGNGENNGDTNQGDSLDSGLLLFVVLIVIISIVGVAVIVYIIRR